MQRLDERTKAGADVVVGETGRWGRQEERGNERESIRLEGNREGPERERDVQDRSKRGGEVMQRKRAGEGLGMQGRTE